MNDCEKYEVLLPVYIDGELDEADSRALEDHLEACPFCSEALARYTELEDSLVSLKNDLPDPSRLADAVVRRLKDVLKPKKKRSAVSFILRARVLAPALTTAAVIASFIFQDRLGSLIHSFASGYSSTLETLLERAGESASVNLSFYFAVYCDAVSRFTESTGAFFLRAGEIDQWTIFSISASFSLFILLWMIRMTRRILED